MDQYIVGARNNEKDNYAIVCKTSYYALASLMCFFTAPFVNEIEIVKVSDVVIVNKPLSHNNEYHHSA